MNSRVSNTENERVRTAEERDTDVSTKKRRKIDPVERAKQERKSDFIHRARIIWQHVIEYLLPPAFGIHFATFRDTEALVSVADAYFPMQYRVSRLIGRRCGGSFVGLLAALRTKSLSMARFLCERVLAKYLPVASLSTRNILSMSVCAAGDVETASTFYRQLFLGQPMRMKGYDLYCACHADSVPLVKWMLETFNFAPDEMQYVLADAVICGSAQVVEMLLNRADFLSIGTKTRVAVLNMCADAGRMEHVNMLLDKATIDDRYSFTYFSSSEAATGEVIKKAFLVAVEAGHYDIAQLLYAPLCNPGTQKTMELICSQFGAGNKDMALFLDNKFLLGAEDIANCIIPNDMYCHICNAFGYDGEDAATWVMARLNPVPRLALDRSRLLSGCLKEGNYASYMILLQGAQFKLPSNTRKLALVQRNALTRACYWDNENEALKLASLHEKHIVATSVAFGLIAGSVKTATLICEKLPYLRNCIFDEIMSSCNLSEMCRSVDVARWVFDNAPDEMATSALQLFGPVLMGNAAMFGRQEVLQYLFDLYRSKSSGSFQADDDTVRSYNRRHVTLLSTAAMCLTFDVDLAVSIADFANSPFEFWSEETITELGNACCEKGTVVSVDFLVERCGFECTPAALRAAIARGHYDIAHYVCRKNSKLLGELLPSPTKLPITLPQITLNVQKESGRAAIAGERYDIAHYVCRKNSKLFGKLLPSPTKLSITLPQITLNVQKESVYEHHRGVQRGGTLDRQLHNLPEWYMYRGEENENADDRDGLSVLTVLKRFRSLGNPSPPYLSIDSELSLTYHAAALQFCYEVWKSSEFVPFVDDNFAAVLTSEDAAWEAANMLCKMYTVEHH